MHVLAHSLRRAKGPEESETHLARWQPEGAQREPNPKSVRCAYSAPAHNTAEERAPRRPSPHEPAAPMRPESLRIEPSRQGQAVHAMPKAANTPIPRATLRMSPTMSPRVMPSPTLSPHVKAEADRRSQRQGEHADPNADSARPQHGRMPTV
jgi:hypothetical protein